MMTAAPVTVEDRAALTDLVHRYAAYADDRDAGALAALFVPDGVLLSPDPPRTVEPVVEARGTAQITAAIEGLSALRLTVHALGGTVLDPVDDDTARGRTVATAHHVVEHGPTDGGTLRDVVWHLRYLDEFRRTPQGWRFTRRALHVDLIESRPVTQAREAT